MPSGFCRRMAPSPTTFARDGICCPPVRTGSCTRPLRIIIAPRKPGKMPSLHHHLRGHCHGTNPLFLPARARCTGVVLPHALLAVAPRRRCPSPADCAIQATPTPPLSRPQTVGGPDAQTALCPVCARRSAAPSAAAGATRAAAPDSSTPPHDRHLNTLLSPYGLSLSRLARAWEPARQRPSQWRSLAPIPLHRVPGLLSRASWHDLS